MKSTKFDLISQIKVGNHVGNNEMTNITYVFMHKKCIFQIYKINMTFKDFVFHV